ncbi:hypothetical protein BKP30_24120 [Rhodococcus erythropolis]|nr:hypothetical protein BKP30_24120 [Rhodococcus erythropolis]
MVPMTFAFTVWRTELSNISATVGCRALEKASKNPRRSPLPLMIFEFRKLGDFGQHLNDYLM